MAFPDDYVINTKPFPDHILFGIGSSAYQTEGAWNEDGKGESIWDRLTHEHPEYIKENANADIAADAYHHYEEDIERLKYLGVDHYRFSIAWTRILPTGLADNINQQGIDFYKKIILKLKEYNIERMVTLYHWDLPQALQDLGGFHSDDFPKWFSDYARICFKYFGDDVKYWITFNEPTILAIGYRIKMFAPGVNDEASGEYLCIHNLLKAHASAYHLYQDEFKAKQNGKISIATLIEYYMPATNSSEDIEASKRTMEFKLGWVEDPLHFGDYPEAMKKRIAWRSKSEGLEKSRLPEFTDEEKEYLKNTTDFFGFNAYGGHYVEAQPESNIGTSSVVYDLGHKFVAVNESERPNVIPELLSFISKRYNYPDIFITENGIALKTVPAPIDDDDRIQLLTHYLSKFRDALDEGIKIIGYSAWSLLDTYEWNNAYTEKYGFYRVDFDHPNRTRTPKKSVNWYKRFLETRSLADSCKNE